MADQLVDPALSNGQTVETTPRVIRILRETTYGEDWAHVLPAWIFSLALNGVLAAIFVVGAFLPGAFLPGCQETKTILVPESSLVQVEDVEVNKDLTNPETGILEGLETNYDVPRI